MTPDPFPSTPSNDAGSTWWLWGVARAEDLGPWSSGEGPAGTVAVAVDDDLGAVVWPAGTESLARTQDAEWVAHVAMLQDRVLSDLLPVLPVRLGTVFSSRDGVAEALRPRSGEIHEWLDRVGRKTEWTLDLLRSDLAVPDAVTSGADYLKMRSADRRSSDPEHAVDVEGALARAGLSADRCRRASVSPERGASRSLRARWILLATEEERERVIAALDELQVEPARFELTGPWPPWSFLDDAGAEA